MKKSITPAIREQASRWVLRLHAADCTAAERREFQAWLASSAMHLQAYQTAESLWRSFSLANQHPTQQIESARDQFKQAQLRQYRRRQVRSTTLAIAASLLVAIGIAPYGWKWLQTETYATVKGQRTEMTLSDGSHVELNTNSQIRVYYAGNTRQVTLDYGEALFSVAHDPEKPFEVIAAAGRIRDIGTRFNVNQWRGVTIVSVLEGEVAVTTDSSSITQNLLPGQQILYDQSGSLSALAEFDAKTITAWRDGLLVFKKATLVEVLEQLNRYHDVELQIADPKLRELKVSGNFPSNDLNRALDVITAALPIKVKRNSPGLIVLER